MSEQGSEKLDETWCADCSVPHAPTCPGTLNGQHSYQPFDDDACRSAWEIANEALEAFEGQESEN